MTIGGTECECGFGLLEGVVGVGGGMMGYSMFGFVALFVAWVVGFVISVGCIICEFTSSIASGHNTTPHQTHPPMTTLLLHLPNPNGIGRRTDSTGIGTFHTNHCGGCETTST